MLAHEPLVAAWPARLDLGFARRGDSTVLARREHSGPLRVQKALHPEGPAVCHAIVLHPPAGIAAGDELDIAVAVDDGAHALLTTPGATKWYRSTGAWASQKLGFAVAEDAVLEWLPQPGIVFDAAQARMALDVRLGSNACFIGWETLCLGRTASGERFKQGRLQLETRISNPHGPLWLERGQIDGGSDLLASPVGLAGRDISATLLAAGRDVTPVLLAACRASEPRETDALTGLSALPKLLVARYLGHDAESAQEWMVDLWRILRPALTGREAQPPRIWNT